MVTAIAGPCCPVWKSTLLVIMLCLRVWNPSTSMPWTHTVPSSSDSHGCVCLVCSARLKDYVRQFVSSVHQEHGGIVLG